MEIELQLRVAALEAENKAFREMFAKEKNHTEKKQTMLALEDIPKEKDHAEKQRMMALEDKAKSAEQMANTWKEKVAATESEAEMRDELYSSLLAESMEYKQKRGAFRRRIEDAWSMFDELNRTLPWEKWEKLHIRRVGEVQHSTAEEMLGIMRSRNITMDFESIQMAFFEEVSELNKLMIKAEFRPLKVTTTMERGQEVPVYSIIYDDPELVKIKEKWGEEIMFQFAEERLYLEKVNASGQHAVHVAWDDQKKDQMDDFDVAQKLVEIVRVLKAENDKNKQKRRKLAGRASTSQR